MPRLRSRKTPGLLARGLGRTKPLPARSLVPAAQGASANVSLQSRPQLQPGHNTRAPEVTPGPPISRPVPAQDEGPGTSLPPGARRGVGVRTFPSASLAGPPGALALVPVCQWLSGQRYSCDHHSGPPTLPSCLTRMSVSVLRDGRVRSTPGVWGCAPPSQTSPSSGLHGRGCGGACPGSVPRSPGD